MARPTKWRKIEHVPAIPYFVPSQDAAEGMPENILKLEELEAIRLKDLEGLEQEECAERMQVSRPTFQRILLASREKVADSLINGKMLHVEGGNYTRNICHVRCEVCGKVWEESYENLELSEDGDCVCPDCGSDRIACDCPCKGKFCGKNCCRYKKKKNDT